jgi:brefeldin A-inhibited guanine nucleotide-exchange protein
MIQARVQNMRSGWRTMFGVFSEAARVNNGVVPSLIVIFDLDVNVEHITTSAFEIVTTLNRAHFEAIVRNGAFADMTVCITDFCKASRFQKISLLAIGMLRGVIPTMLQSDECMVPVEPSPDSTAGPGGDDSNIKYWFPILFSFFDIIMNGEDLEVRQMWDSITKLSTVSHLHFPRALESLFSTLKNHGPNFPEEFWDTIFRELIFPIFAVLKSASDVSRFSTQEDMSVWFSTTMVEALRNVIDLYSHHFDLLHQTFGGLLDLLCTCVCQGFY